MAIVTIQIRRDSAADWTSANPVLAEGELGLELDTNQFKIGNGIDDWATLPYFSATTGEWGSITGDIEDQTDLKNKFSDFVNRGREYYLTSVASDQGGGKLQMIKTIPAGGGFGINASSVSDTDIIADFNSVSDAFNSTHLPSGLMTFRVNARQTAGTKVSRLYAEFYTRTVPGGVETVHATTQFSEVLTGSTQEVGGIAITPVIAGLSSTDRIGVRFLANVTGAGTYPDITIDIQGINYSRISIPLSSEQQSVVWGGIGGTLSNQTDLQAQLDTKQDSLIGSNNQIFYQSAPGVIDPVDSIIVNQFGTLSETINLEPDNGGFTGINNVNVSIDPQQNSPNEQYTLYNVYVNSDSNDSGFSLGTANNAFQGINQFYDHQGTGDIGNISFLTSGFNIGNGTDPIDSGGMGYSFGFGRVYSDVTLSGPLQGYGFQPRVDSGAIFGSGSYVNAFYDFSEIDTSCNYYTSFAASPTIADINTNNSYSGLNLNPTITALTGNASVTGVGIYGNYGAFDTGNYKGLDIQPTITNVTNPVGLRVDMSNVTGTGIQAAQFTGDVSINGNLSFTGALSVGQVNAFYAEIMNDGSGAPASLHSLVTSFTGADSVTTANIDGIGVNTAMLVTLEEDSINTSGPFKLGAAAMAMPCVVTTHTGSSLDFMNMGAFALNLDGSSTGGTIGRINGARVEAIPNGITTVNEFVAFEFDQSFGQVGTDVWGLHIVPTYAENFLGGSLKIGGTDKVANSSTALEIESTTKAFLNARMTTAERDSLTGIDGMQVYNVTTNKLQVRASGSWVDLH